MKKFWSTLLLGTSIVSFSAYALNGDSLGRVWNKASFDTRYSYASSVAAVVNAKAGRVVTHPQEIVSCMNEVFRPPMEPYIRAMTVGEVAAGCIRTLLGM